MIDENKYNIQAATQMMKGLLKVATQDIKNVESDFSNNATKYNAKETKQVQSFLDELNEKLPEAIEGIGKVDDLAKRYQK